MKYKIGLIISVGIIIALAIFSYNKVKSLERVLDYNETLKDSITNYSLKIDGLEVEVSETSASIITLKEALQLEIIDKELYKKLYLTSLSSITKLNGQIIILKDSLQVLPDSIFTTIVDTNRTYQAIKLPYEWSYKDKYLDFKTGVRENNHPYFSVNMSLDAKIIIGARKQSIGILVTDNPYFKTTKMEVVIIHGKQPFYSKWWFTGGVGIIIGSLLAR